MKKLQPNTHSLKIAVALMFCAATPALASPWTSVASAGAVDEADQAEVSYSAGTATILAGAPASTSVTIRYNVVAAPDLDNGGVNKTMSVRFLDNGANAQVTLNLVKYNYATGVSTTLLTLNSNNYAANGAYQTQTVGDGCWAEQFDFYNNAYYVEAVISRTAATGSAGLAIIRIEDVDLC